MRKMIVGALACLIVALPFNIVTAGEGITSKHNVAVTSYVSDAYNSINFNSCSKLPYDAFESAYKGYLNLKSAGKLNNDKQIITVCDFKLPSTEKRMWIIDLANGKVLFNTYVAHGHGSGEEYATSFSNTASTHKSSLGFFVTGETYDGAHGTSLRLNGMDEGFNDAAYDRGIVVHGAEYVSDKFIAAKDMLGRSWGCPAVPSRLSLPIINAIKDGTCLFIYYPESRYMKSAHWLNKNIADVPGSPLASGAVAGVANSVQ